MTPRYISNQTSFVQTQETSHSAAEFADDSWTISFEGGVKTSGLNPVNSARSYQGVLRTRVNGIRKRSDTFFSEDHTNKDNIDSNREGESTLLTTSHHFEEEFLWQCCEMLSPEVPGPQ
jgi:hypothetical protein